MRNESAMIKQPVKIIVRPDCTTMSMNRGLRIPPVCACSSVFGDRTDCVQHRAMESSPKPPMIPVPLVMNRMSNALEVCTLGLSRSRLGEH